MTPPQSSRRDFLRMTALAAASTTLRLSSRAAEPSTDRSPIIVFSKPFQDLGAKETAALVADIGWDGIECPVRSKGQLEASAAAEQLPRFLEAFSARGLTIPVVVSDITSIRQPHAEDLLRTCARVGIKRIRLGFWKYDFAQPILPQVDKVSRDLKEIGQACQALGIHAGAENHSGATMFGAPVWDIVRAIQEVSAQNIGIFFDIGHATIEGGMSWPVQAKLAEPYYQTVYVKDFTWKKENDRWRSRWCPLGQGMIDPGFLKTLKQSSYRGPICQHHEYPLGDHAETIQHYRQDLAVLKGWLA